MLEWAKDQSSTHDANEYRRVGAKTSKSFHAASSSHGRWKLNTLVHFVGVLRWAECAVVGGC